MKKFIKRIPVLHQIASFIYFIFIAPLQKFSNSDEYWKKRYKSGGTSGACSCSHLAVFKAEILNEFVKKNKIRKVIEFGCGDGKQLELADYPSYIGFDVSKDALSQCEKQFIGKDKNKQFILMDSYKNETAELTTSLDVIYCLVEEAIFCHYMNILFDSSTKYVIIYSSNTEKQFKLQAKYIKHRKFSNWIEKNKPEWKLKKYIPNKYPYKGNDQSGSFSDFYIYEKTLPLSIKI